MQQKEKDHEAEMQRVEAEVAELGKTLEELNRRIAENDVLAVIIDIDTVAVDNRTIRDLTLRNPAIYFFCLSERRFHPELEDAICYHIYACINKPIDPDELIFWIDSIRKEGKST